MKFLTISTVAFCAVLPALADTKPQPPPATTANRMLPKEHISSSAPTQSSVMIPKKSGGLTPPPTSGTNQAPTAPAPAASAPVAPAPAASSPKTNPALSAYLDALNDQLTLSKSEQTDIKTYYLADGAKIQSILNDDALSPIDQQRQVDDLRTARNAKIDALLKDVDRQGKFREVENSHRVDLIKAAANGGLNASAPLPNVPQPTGTTPAQADKGSPASPRADSAAGQSGG